MTADPLDQAENPRIRTKTNNLSPQVDRGYFELIKQLFDKEISTRHYLDQCLAYFEPIVLGGELSAFEETAMKTDGQLELLRRHIDHCRYTVLLYRVDEKEVHPPHHHHNVASTQIVVQGKLRLREYERVNRDKNGRLVLSLVNDCVLQRGDRFQASEWYRNVHWFQAIDGPAVVFNTNARGFEDKTFDPQEAHFGRRYIDPTHCENRSNIHCQEFDETEALKRFAGRPLDDFPIPVHKSD